MAFQTATNTPSGSKTVKNLTMLSSIDSPKVKDGKELTLDPVVPVALIDQVMLPCSVGSSFHSFIGYLLDTNQVEKVLTFFPCLVNQDILASKEKNSL